MEITFRTAGPRDLAAVRRLFEEYAGSLDIDLDFQGFADELAGLPGKYAEPQGTILLAEQDGTPCGCIALRPLPAGSAAGRKACEMKRLFVRPSARGLGLGRELVRRILEEARARGYDVMRLDTLPSMADAVRLYRSFGFRDIDAYIYNPLPGAMYMEKRLESPGVSGPAPGEKHGHR